MASRAAQASEPASSASRPSRVLYRSLMSAALLAPANSSEFRKALAMSDSEVPLLTASTKDLAPFWSASRPRMPWYRRRAAASASLCARAMVSTLSSASTKVRNSALLMAAVWLPVRLTLKLLPAVRS
ncbi:hypothetical protein D3C80_1411900 [compost metagenome]